eukprot:m.80142 g.80142  ORF g.80142 m.80142 type:complete len:227 (+) comp17467_c0_seq1:233-913(+)
MTLGQQSSHLSSSFREFYLRDLSHCSYLLFNSGVGRQARRATAFVSEFMDLPMSPLQLQTIDEDAASFLDWVPESNDDRILHCCMDRQRRYHAHGRVLLITDDRNLRLKAKAHKVSVMLPRELQGEASAFIGHAQALFCSVEHPETAVMLAKPEPMEFSGKAGRSLSDVHGQHGGAGEAAEDLESARSPTAHRDSSVTVWCNCSKLPDLHTEDDHDFSRPRDMDID